MKKKLRSLLTLCLALVLSMSFSSFVWAVVPAPDVEDATAAVTKELKMPTTTVTPEATFSFTATAVSVDGHTDRADTAPAATIADITFSAADTGTDDGTIKSVIAESPVEFGAFPHAGVYVYTVKETADTTTFADPAKQDLTYSSAEYKMSVYVTNTDAGLHIDTIEVIPTKNDAGEAITDGDKVDPTPNEEGNGFCFVNSYKEISGPVDPNEDYDSLKVDKVVTGNMGDNTLDFTFTLTVTGTSFDAADATYTYTKYLQDGTTEDGTLTSGTGADFTLKHGEYIIVKNVTVGSTYSVSETNIDSNYTFTATASVATDTVTAATPEVDGTFVSDGNGATFTNDYSTDIPTGILINNLPFMMLIIVAAAGIAVYFISRRRRAQ